MTDSDIPEEWLEIHRKRFAEWFEEGAAAQLEAMKSPHWGSKARENAQREADVRAGAEVLKPCPGCGSAAYMRGPWIFCTKCSMRACGADMVNDWQTRT